MLGFLFNRSRTLRTVVIGEVRGADAVSLLRSDTRAGMATVHTATPRSLFASADASLPCAVTPPIPHLGN